MQIMVSSPAWELRQMAAVELRKRSVKWWPQYDPQLQVEMKKKLLEFSFTEPE